ncbi:MAG: tetratricopeptide repeat-containing sensor histidine kinase, partial [Bacteroidota bacterium]
LLLFLAFLVQFSFAQNQRRIDSLLLSEKKFLIQKDTNALANINFLIAEYYDHEKSYDSAVFFYQKTFDYAILLNNKPRIAYLYKALGKISWIQGDMGEALIYYNKSLPVAQSINDTSLTSILYNNIGTIYWGIADYDKALEFYYLSLSLRDSLNDEEGKSLTLNNIGMVFSEWGKDDEAFNYYKRASIICNKIDYTFGIAYSYYNLGNHYLKKQNLDSAIVSFKLAINNYKIIGKMIGVSICYEKMGDVYEMREDYKSAMLYYNKMLAIADSENNLKNKVIAFYHIAHLNFSKGNLSEALMYVQKSSSISKEKNYKNLCNKNYRLLADINKKKGNYKKALEYYVIANQYKDSIFNDEKTKQITRMEVVHKTAQKERENFALKKEQEKQLARLEAGKLTIRFQNVVVIAIIILLLLVFVFALIFYREKQKLKIANNTKNKLFSIISHDLRGPLGNFKGLIDLLLIDEKIDDPEKINSLLKLMQKTASSNYDLLENLLSWSGTKSGNLVYQPQKLNLKILVDSVFEHNEYNAQVKSIQLISEIDEKIYVLADDLMLHTILRNLVSNAIKFTGKKGTVIVKSQKMSEKNDKEKNNIEIIVSDNGVGIDQEILPNIFTDDEFYSTRGTDNENGSGFGLKLCKEFVDKHKGEIRVESVQNGGSDFIFTILEYTAKTKN